MLGYIRPYTDELTISELRRYRAVYCGICKRLAAQYGLFERMAVSYDSSFLALLFLALSDDEPEELAERCIIHPFNKRLIAQESPILDFAAGLTTFLAYQKGLDDRADANPVRGRLVSTCFRSGAQKFADKHPQLTGQLTEILASALEKERALTPELSQDPHRDTESEFSRPEQARQRAEALSAYSGQALALIFQEASSLLPEGALADTRYEHILKALGQALGEWVYLIDAYADWEEDLKQGSFNPYAALPEEDYHKLAPALLEEKTNTINALAALLPYRKDAAIIENILYAGLRQSQDRIRRKQRLEPLQQGAFL